MKEINGKRYFNVEEIVETFENQLLEKDILGYLDEGLINGEKIEGKWYFQEAELSNVKKVFLEKNMHSITQHSIDLTSENFKRDGRVLDIGGGGEGIIGQHLGDRVVSIDNQREEFEEAIQNGDDKSLKIIMDARDLQFLNESFGSVIAFFSLLYMQPEDLPKVFDEIHRVLKKEGIFTIWEVEIPENKEKKKKFFAVPLEIKMADKTINTSYGTTWEKSQGIKTYEKLGMDAGFQILGKTKKGSIFKLRMKKTP